MSVATAQVQEAVSEIAEGAGAVVGEVAALETALEQAAARVAVAEETAQAVADAALMTALGERVAALETRVTEWLNDYGPRVNALLERMTQAEATLQQTLATLEEISEEIPEEPIAVVLPTGTEASSIPAASEVLTEAETVVSPMTAINPAMPEGPVVVIPAAAKRRVRLL